MVFDEYGHTPVLLKEVLDGLSLHTGGFYVDCTFGRGGHSAAILSRLDQTGQLLALDKDQVAIDYSKQKFSKDSRFHCRHGSYTCLSRVIDEYSKMGEVDGVLFDLGVSSPQLDDSERGFSFMNDGPLDMRMDTTTGFSAADWIEHVKKDELARVLFSYGEERFSRRIAAAIVNARENEKITTTLQLANIIKESAPYKQKDKHPATRSFQAIRIFINNEIEELKEGLQQAFSVLRTGGRLVVISFHSLEDRIVKRFMREHAKADPYPKNLPIKADSIHSRMKIISKPVKASEKEIQLNVRSRSAVLRIGEKLT